MYARTTIIQADPTKIDDGIAYVRDRIIPAVMELDGCVGMSLLVDRGSARCIAATAWESADALRASAEKVRPLRDSAEQTLGTSTSTVDAWEVAAVHRDHASPDGACARVTWLSGDPAMAERAVDVFKMAVLPKVEELDGFCSGSLFINRETGRAVGAITFDSRTQLEGSRDAAARIRATASDELGATVDRVEEMELALAHLHVPELV